METITCKHANVKTLSVTGFGGEVSVAPYTATKPSAHGNITEHVECTDCGARRRENINGLHVEVSPWRGSAAEREAVVARARAEAKRTRPEPVTMTRGSDGATVVVAVNADGQLVIDAPTFAAQKAIVGALPAQFVSAYEAHSKAIEALRAAEAEVAS
jgi:hypothetical protein